MKETHKKISKKRKTNKMGMHYIIHISHIGMYIYVRERSKGMHTKSVREARDRGAVNLVKRNAIVFNPPEGSIQGFRGYGSWSHSDCHADLLHGLLFYSLSLFLFVTEQPATHSNRRAVSLAFMQSYQI
jgi:hypothetical protein